MLVQTLVNGSELRGVITVIQRNFLEFWHSFYLLLWVWYESVMILLLEGATSSLFSLPFCVCQITLGKGCLILFLCLLLFSSCRLMYIGWGLQVFFFFFFCQPKALPCIEPSLRGLRAKHWSQSSAQALDTPAKV